MARPTGRTPRRKSVVKRDGVRHLEVHHCNGCDVVMPEINLPTLHLWQPGFNYVKKYPFTEPTFFCDPCREKYDLPHKNYVLVPMRDDQTLQQALITLLESLQGVDDAPSGPADDSSGIGLCD